VEGGVSHKVGEKREPGVKNGTTVAETRGREKKKGDSENCSSRVGGETSERHDKD